MQLRDLVTLDDFRRVVEIERRVWGFTDLDVVPVPILVITVKRGGILIGGFDDKGEMVGFVYSLAGLKDGRPMQWSHMLGVLDSSRNAGLGFQLKLAQRTRALERGLDLIEWTFDPLQALNAHLNLRKLGVVVEDYAENVYGESSSPLHRGTPTDRLIAEWNIATPHVERRLAAYGSLGDVRDEAALSAPAVNRTRLDGPWRVNEAMDLEIEAGRVWVEIPVGFTEMQARNPPAAAAWRLETRQMFTTYFERGYRAVDFALDRHEQRGRYLLARR
jgi:predicted GNAT superfamily acetyltransferase